MVAVPPSTGKDIPLSTSATRRVSVLPARAIENLSYVIGVNRTGTDATNLHYLGGSAVLDYLGQALAEADDTPQVRTARLSHAELAAFRQRFPAYLDADRFTLDD